MTVIAMIPARMGSKRLKTKNLRELDGVPLITRAIRKALAARVFDEVWVNSEHDRFAEIAATEGAAFHRRPAELADDQATSEEFVAEFLQKHPCERVVQVHSIAPLISAATVAGFVDAFVQSMADCMFSVVYEPLECLYAGEPVNFSFLGKQNSQDLEPVERVTWGLTGWRRDAYLEAHRSGGCATWSGRRATFELDRVEGHVIKTAGDLVLAECLLSSATSGQALLNQE